MPFLPFFPVILPTCSLYPQQKRAYSALHPQAWTYIYRSMPEGSYRVQSPGFPKIVYWRVNRSYWLKFIYKQNHDIVVCKVKICWKSVVKQRSPLTAVKTMTWSWREAEADRVFVKSRSSLNVRHRAVDMLLTWRLLCFSLCCQLYFCVSVNSWDFCP